MEIRRASCQSDLFKLIHLRTEVFSDEQQVDFHIEQDDKDIDAIHYIALINDEAVGCLRLLMEEDTLIVGRVAVKKEYRHSHIGKALMNAIELDEECLKRKKITLHAQCIAKEFYIKCGYIQASDVYLEAGIEHIMMEKQL